MIKFIVSSLIIQIIKCLFHCDNPQYETFQGCIDTHSSIAGTWALLAYCRLVDTHDSYLQLIEKLLQKNKLKNELNYWRLYPNFEMPYGRSWFLRLAIEYGSLFKTDDFEELSNDVAQSIIDYLKGSNIFMNVEYKDPFFALVNLWDYGLYYNKPDIINFIKSIVDETKITTCHIGTVQVFMDMCLNRIWLFSKVMNKKDFMIWIKPHMNSILALQPIKKYTTPHEYGLNFSRCWVLWSLYEKTLDQRFAQLYIDHFIESYKNKSKWETHYETLGHWVSNFAFMAIYPLLKK